MRIALILRTRICTISLLVTSLYRCWELWLLLVGVVRSPLFSTLTRVNVRGVTSILKTRQSFTIILIRNRFICLLRTRCSGVHVPRRVIRLIHNMNIHCVISRLGVTTNRYHFPEHEKIDLTIFSSYRCEYIGLGVHYFVE